MTWRLFAYDLHFDMAGAGGQLTLATLGGLGNLDRSGAAACKKDLRGQQASRNMASVGLNENFSCITAIKLDITGASCEGKTLPGGYICQVHISGAAL